MNYFDLLSTEEDEEAHGSGEEGDNTMSPMTNGAGAETDGKNKNKKNKKKKKKKKKSNNKTNKNNNNKNVNGYPEEEEEEEDVDDATHTDDKNGELDKLDGDRFETVQRKTKRSAKTVEEKRLFREQEKAFQKKLDEQFEADMLMDNWDGGGEGYSGGAGFGGTAGAAKPIFGANKGKALQHREVEKRAYRMEKRSAQRQGLECPDGDAIKPKKRADKAGETYTNDARAERIKSAHLKDPH